MRRKVLILCFVMFVAVLILSGCGNQEDEMVKINNQAFFTGGARGTERFGSVKDSIGNWVEEGEIVGAELLIIENRDILVHETYGWKDLEEEVPMEADTIFRIRSMTKPFVATSILILAEEGRLSLADEVSKHLPSFDNENSGCITIEQLLTHTGGLDQPGYPKDIESYGSLIEAVDDVGANGPSIKPGSKYAYSDAGTATLGALVSEVSGMPLEEFIEERILGPLGMDDTFCTLEDHEARRGRMSSTYVKSGDRYVKYWDNSDKQVMKYFRGSGGMYSTPLDYAKFLYMWTNGGCIDEDRIIAEECVADALKGGNLNERYGYQWEIFSDVAAESAGSTGMLPVFGHGGSDGTIAFSVPEKNIIVCYFTQSRSTHTVRLVKSMVLDELGIKSHSYYERVNVDTEVYRDYEGKYQHPHIAIYIRKEGDDLYMKTQDSSDLLFLPASRDFFFHELMDVQITFVRNENNEVTGLIIHQNGEDIEADKCGL